VTRLLLHLCSYTDHLAMLVPGAPEPERHSAAAAATGPVHIVTLAPAAADGAAPMEATAAPAPAMPDHSAAELEALQERLVSVHGNCMSFKTIPQASLVPGHTRMPAAACCYSTYSTCKVAGMSCLAPPAPGVVPGGVRQSEHKTHHFCVNCPCRRRRRLRSPRRRRRQSLPRRGARRLRLPSSRRRPPGRPPTVWPRLSRRASRLQSRSGLTVPLAPCIASPMQDPNQSEVHSQFVPFHI